MTKYDGEPIPIEEDRSADTFARLMHERRSCRAFLDTPVSETTITKIVGMAQLSASWCNTQPWHVIITRPAETDRIRRVLSHHARRNGPEPDFDFPSAYTGVRLERRREVAAQLYESVGIAQGDRAGSAVQTHKNFEFFGAPHIALVTTDAELGTYGAVDCGVFVGTFLLAAQSVGVATIPQAALASFAPLLRDNYAIPADQKLLLGISFGYADKEHPANAFRTRRASLDDVITWV